MLPSNTIRPTGTITKSSSIMLACTLKKIYTKPLKYQNNSFCILGPDSIVACPFFLTYFIVCVIIIYSTSNATSANLWYNMPKVDSTFRVKFIHNPRYNLKCVINERKLLIVSQTHLDKDYYLSYMKSKWHFW